MSMYNINKIDWGKVQGRLSNSNKKLYDLLLPIANIIHVDKLDYLYVAQYAFGDPIIFNGRCLWLEKYRTDKESRFINDFQRTTGHPLSIIFENYIEIYSKQESFDINSRQENEYDYPLNLIKAGDVFGVWESINVIQGKEVEYSGWSAVAGKKCIITTLPGNVRHKCSSQYRNSFSKIFDGCETSIEAFNSIIKKNNTKNYFVEVYMIPEYYYLINEDDTEQLKMHKTNLCLYIYGIGWAQEEEMRISRWVKDYTYKGLILNEDYCLQIRRHIINIIKRKSFIVRPVLSTDGLLYDAFVKIYERMCAVTDKKKGDLIEKEFPMFFHYDIINENTPFSFEIIHQPSVKIIHTKFTLESMKPDIYRYFIGNKELEAELGKSGDIIKLGFYTKMMYEESNYGKDKRTDLYKKVAECYSEDLKVTSVSCTHPPSFLNMLLTIKIA